MGKYSPHYSLVSADTIKDVWNKLREIYRKCMKKREQKTRSGAGHGRLPSCNFFNELQFLSDSLKNKPSESNIARNFDKGNTPSVIEDDFTPRRLIWS